MYARFFLHLEKSYIHYENNIFMLFVTTIN